MLRASDGWRERVGVERGRVGEGRGKEGKKIIGSRVGRKGRRNYENRKERRKENASQERWKVVECQGSEVELKERGKAKVKGMEGGRIRSREKSYNSIKCERDVEMR